MATFKEHIEQAKKNITFLVEVNKNCNLFWDWQTTICYYVGVHLINSHLANCGDLHYRSHEDVKTALNPFNPASICKVPQDIYLAYTNLELLSRRSRYLINDKLNNRTTEACFTSDKHFAKSIRHLNTIMKYIKLKYSEVDFDKNKINCDRICNDDLEFYEHKN